MIIVEQVFSIGKDVVRDMSTSTHGTEKEINRNLPNKKTTPNAMNLINNYHLIGSTRFKSSY